MQQPSNSAAATGSADENLHQILLGLARARNRGRRLAPSAPGGWGVAPLWGFPDPSVKEEVFASSQAARPPILLGAIQNAKTQRPAFKPVKFHARASHSYPHRNPSPGGRGALRFTFSSGVGAYADNSNSNLFNRFT